MSVLDAVDHEALKRGSDMQTDIPDGSINFNKINSSTFDITLSINDWRLPEYHKNNGVTKLDLHS